jgi:hypothetical protein
VGQLDMSIIGTSSSLTHYPDLVIIFEILCYKELNYFTLEQRYLERNG